MNPSILQAALKNYLTLDLPDHERKETELTLSRLDENSQHFWGDFLNNDEKLAHHYSDALDNQGESFYDSLPQF